MIKLGNKIKTIVSVDPDRFEIVLRFADGFLGRVSFLEMFSKPKGLLSEILIGNMFRNCFIENGSLAWPNGLEFCPDALRELIQKQKKRGRNLTSLNDSASV